VHGDLPVGVRNMSERSERTIGNERVHRAERGERVEGVGSRSEATP